MSERSIRSMHVNFHVHSLVEPINQDEIGFTIMEKVTTYIYVGQPEKFPLVKVWHRFAYKISQKKKVKIVSLYGFVHAKWFVWFVEVYNDFWNGEEKKKKKGRETNRFLDVKKARYPGIDRNCWKFQFRLKYAGWSRI